MKSFNDFFKQILLEAESEDNETQESSKIIDFVMSDDLENDFEKLKENKDFISMIDSADQDSIQEAVKEIYEQHIENEDSDDTEDKKAFLEKVVNFLNEKVQK